MIEHKENCLIIYDKQSVKLKSGSVSFKSYFKQLPAPFKIYADSEYPLKAVKSSDKNNGSYTEKYQDHVPCSFAYKVVCIDKGGSLQRKKNAVYMFIKAILEGYDYCKK